MPKDPRIIKAAEILVDYSTKIKKNDYVQILGDPEAKDLILEIYRLCIQRGAYPVLKIGLPGQSFIYYKNASKEQLEKFPELIMEEIKKTDAYIAIRSGSNTRELTNIDPKLISLRQKILKPIQNERLKKKWVLYDYPSPSLAQEADMSTEEFEDFVFSATNIDWKTFSKRLESIKKIMQSGDEVHITGEETDIKFRTKGRKYIAGNGTHNMPDGEIFTAPVETTTEGHIKFSYPAIYGGREVDGVYLDFKKGNIMNFSAKKNENFLKTMIETDEGSKRLGELGIGLNPMIKKPIKNILFDEKLDGTIHLAIGSAYKECNGVNESSVHWDMIKDLKNNGKIFLDGKLIYKDGKFLNVK